MKEINDRAESQQALGSQPNSIDELLNPTPVKFHGDTKRHFMKKRARAKNKLARLARRYNR